MYRIVRILLITVALHFPLVAAAQSISIGGISVSVTGQGSVTILQPGVPDQVCTPSSASADCKTLSSPQTSEDVFTFAASSEAGWVFVEWLMDGSYAGSSATITRGPFPSYFVPPESLQAIFVPQTSLDSDGDGVYDGVDQCPSTPPGESVDPSTGCSVSSGNNNSPADTDRDGVPDDTDLCPYTVPGRGFEIDANGCAEDEIDTDDDGVVDSRDQCPDTNTGESINKKGCSEAQIDEDADGVVNSADQCPSTLAGKLVDIEGCSASQKDTDLDGVNDELDRCPATPAGESTDLAGCADSQLDEDGDGVSDLLDECPATPTGELADSIGCSEGQRDDDGDGVPNSNDTCAATEKGKSANDEGCSVVQKQLADLGEDLVELDGLSEDDETLAGAIDDACPRLIIEGDQQALTAGQQDLLVACSSLKANDSSSDQQVAALQAISPQLLANRIDAVIETASRHHQQLTQRLGRIKTGGGRGVSLAGLSLNFAGQALPGALLEEAADQAGMGDLGPDFGNWGVYLAGRFGCD